MLKEYRYMRVFSLSVSILDVLLVAAACAVSSQGVVISQPVQSRTDAPEAMVARGDAPRGFEEVVVSTAWMAERLEDPNVPALLGNRFQFSRLTAGNSATALLGGVLMGWGAMTALGCTVGTLLSGISAFALSGWVFAVAMFAGVWLGIKLGLHAG
jgi:hypothetical protein